MSGYGHGGEPATRRGEQAKEEQAQDRLDRISEDLGDSDSGSGDDSSDGTSGDRASPGGSGAPGDIANREEEVEGGDQPAEGGGSDDSSGSSRSRDSSDASDSSGPYTSPQGTYPGRRSQGRTPRDQTPEGISEQRARDIRQQVAARDEAVSRYDVDVERQNGQIEARVREGAQRRVAEQRYAQRTPYEDWEVRASDSQVRPTQDARDRVLRERVAEQRDVSPERVSVDRSMVGESGTSPAGRGRPGEVGPRVEVSEDAGATWSPEEQEAEPDGAVDRFRRTVMDAEVGDVTNPDSPVRQRTRQAAEEWRPRLRRQVVESVARRGLPLGGGTAAGADLAGDAATLASAAGDELRDDVPARAEPLVSTVRGAESATNVPAIADSVVAGGQAGIYVASGAEDGASEVGGRLQDVGEAGLAVSRDAGRGARANPQEFAAATVTGAAVGAGAGSVARGGVSAARAGIRAARRSPDAPDATAAMRQASRSDVSPDRPDPWSDIDASSSLRKLWEDEGGTAQIPRGRRRRGRQQRQETEPDPDQPSVERGGREVLEGSPRDQIQGDIASRQLDARRQVEADALEPRSMARDPASRDPIAEGRVLREQAQRSEVRVSDAALSGSEAIGQPLALREGLSTAGAAALRQEAQEAAVTAEEEWEASIVGSLTAGVNEEVRDLGMVEESVEIGQGERDRSDVAPATREDTQQRPVTAPPPTPPTETPETPPSTPPEPPVTPPSPPTRPPTRRPTVRPPGLDREPERTAPADTQSSDGWSLEPTAADRELEPGWTAETITAAGTLGLEPRGVPSQAALESADAPAGELPTTQLLEDDEDVEAVRDLFDPQGNGDETGDSDLLDVGFDVGDESGVEGWF